MKEKLIYNIVYMFFKLLAQLPLRVLYVLSEIVYIIVYHIARYRRRVVRKNLEMVFKDKTTTEIISIEKKYYHHLCDVIFETVKLLHISDKEIDRRVEVTNGDLIESLAQDGRSFVVFMGHYANWEWVQAIVRHCKQPEKFGQIYRRLRNPVMDRLMLKIRSRFGNISIEQRGAVRTLLALYKQQQMVIGFISDQRPLGDNLPHWTTFMGQDTAYFVGGENIGAKIKSHFIYLDIEKVKRGHYRITFVEMDASDINGENPYTRKFLQMLENTIRREPSLWMWSHNRWKAKRK